MLSGPFPMQQYGMGMPGMAGMQGTGMTECREWNDARHDRHAGTGMMPTMEPPWRSSQMMMAGALMQQMMRSGRSPNSRHDRPICQS